MSFVFGYMATAWTLTIGLLLISFGDPWAVWLGATMAASAILVVIGFLFRHRRGDATAGLPTVADKIESTDLGCRACGSPHRADTLRVEAEWLPNPLRCLVIGESPGSPGSLHFYENVAIGSSDPIEVRRHLLEGLARRALIPTASLESFKTAGFFFDHAVRCQLPASVITTERKRAQRFDSSLASGAAHLATLIPQAETVWIMGLLARDTVVQQGRLPREAVDRKLDPPFTPAGYPTYFISRYLNRYADIDTVLDSYAAFRRP